MMDCYWLFQFVLKLMKISEYASKLVHNLRQQLLASFHPYIHKLRTLMLQCQQYNRMQFSYLIILNININIDYMTQPSTETSGSMKIALISALGNWIGDTILFPLDTISTRLKASKHQNQSPLNFAVSAISQQKMNLFKGVQLTFPASFIPSLIYLTVYDHGMKVISHYLHKNTYDDRVKLVFPFFVSSLAQVVALFLYLPVDTVRTRIQMNKPQYSYQSFTSALKQIKNKQGISRFYKSSKIFFASKTLYTAVQFQTFQIIRYLTGPSWYWMIANTIISTAFAVLLLNPLEVLITRYALVDTTKKKLAFWHMVKKINRREGIRGFYKGYPTETLYNCTYALFWLPLYQVLREKVGVEQAQ